MKFTKIRVSGISVADFPIVGLTPTSPYILKSVVGLGPPEIKAIFGNALRRGGVFQNTLPQPREIVMRIGLNADYQAGMTPSDLRSSLYWMLESETLGGNTLRIMDGDTSVAETMVWVKSFEAVPWSQTPEIQITFGSDSPYLVSPTAVTRSSSSYALTFPEIIGTARAPFTLRGRVLQNTNQFGVRRFYNGATSPNEFIGFQPYNFQAGDIVRIDTQPGKRVASVTRGSQVVNILGALIPGSDWPALDPNGPNEIRINGLEYPMMRLEEVKYYPHYWGI